jgi:DNA-formamidopyrimidine glycosylase
LYCGICHQDVTSSQREQRTLLGYNGSVTDERLGSVIPEGPEIRRSTDFLHKLLGAKAPGRIRLVNVSVIGGRYLEKPPEGLEAFNAYKLDEHITVEGVGCRGKFQYWDFHPGWTMWCTYGMSGQWSTQCTKHAALELVYRDESEGAYPGLSCVWFNDPRHFGTVKFLHDPDGVKTQAKLDSLGPDMLNDPPDETKFRRELLCKHGWTLAEVLMDQSVVCGVGNYVKAESLYKARLSPHRLVRDMSTVEFETLRQSIIDVMQTSLNSGGATISTYRNPDGSEGEAQKRFAVYGNKVDPMGNPVIKEKTLDGRTTWWCPQVQN